MSNIVHILHFIYIHVRIIYNKVYTGTTLYCHIILIIICSNIYTIKTSSFLNLLKADLWWDCQHFT